MNFIAIKGRLTRDPDYSVTQSGVERCTFSVAVERKYAKKGEDRQVDYFNCLAWRQTAVFINNYFTKGKEILITGEMQMDKYTDKEGNERTAWILAVSNVEFCGSKGDSASSSASTSAAPATEGASDFTEIDDSKLPF